MTERDNQIFDKIIRNKVSQYKEPVSDDIWENISKRRQFSSFLTTNYKLILSVIIMSVLTLVVTIPMTYKSKSEKDGQNLVSVKSHVSSVLLNAPEQTSKTIKTNHISKTKTFKTEESNKIIEKQVIQNTTKVIATTTDISSKIPITKGQSDDRGTTEILQRSDKNESDITSNNDSKTNNPTPLINRSNDSPVIEISYIEPVTQTTSIQPGSEIVIPPKILNIPTDTESAYRNIPVILTDNNLTGKPVDQTQSPLADSNLLKQPENITTPSDPLQSHFSCLDFIFSPGLVTKSIIAIDPASQSYARILDRVTKTRYSMGFEIRYRYYLNQFWNLATGVMYTQIKEQMYGQIMAEHNATKLIPCSIITPFDPPKQIFLSDTFKVPQKNISQYNTYSYLQIPALLGANFSLFKIPLNLYAGVGYFFAIKQEGAYINSATLESTNFQTGIDNPYKNVQGLSMRAGINASKQISRRSAFFIGADYTRYVISIKDKQYQFQQYYSVWNLNLGITYQLF